MQNKDKMDKADGSPLALTVLLKVFTSSYFTPLKMFNQSVYLC